MLVEVWSDVMCPFCYIGKRRFEKGLSQFAQREQIEVVYRSFELDPNAPKDLDLDMHEVLSEKYGMSLEQAKAMSDQVIGQAASEGLEYHFDSMVMTNSFDAHRLMHFARAKGKGPEVVELVFKAYFTDSKHVGKREVLASIAQDAGLSYDEAMEMLASDQYADAVRADEHEARNLGVQGVPFYVVDRKYAVSGAQPAAMFQEVLEKAWHEANPLTLVNTGDQAGGICTDGSCTIDPK